jgi:hypothetical protein
MCNQPICKCGYDSCLNGGSFIPSTCSCICSFQYTGFRCNTLIPTTTTSNNKTNATKITLTSNTSLRPTTTTSLASNCSQQIKCLNGAKLNSMCKCECILILEYIVK